MKAIIVGGSNGIGLAAAKQFILKGYTAEILDISEPDVSMQEFKGRYHYRPCNLLDFDEDLFSELAQDENVKALMATAGFGRVADFEYLHTAEIEELIQVNALGGIKIVRIFYERIKSDDEFLCGMMGSTAGLISSPRVNYIIMVAMLATEREVAA